MKLYRLRELNIYSLYCRRKHNDLIETYKLLKGYYNIDWSKLFTISPVHYTKRSPTETLKVAYLTSADILLKEDIVGAETTLSGRVPFIGDSLCKEISPMYWQEIGRGYEQRPGA